MYTDNSRAEIANAACLVLQLMARHCVPVLFIKAEEDDTIYSMLVATEKITSTEPNAKVAPRLFLGDGTPAPRTGGTA